MNTKHLRTKLSVLLTTALFLFSCNKNNDHPNPGPAPAAKKIWKIKINQTDSALFAYTTTGLLHKVISTDNGNGSNTSSFTFQYDATNRITEISSAEGVKHKFVYENNRLRLTENFQGLNKVSENVFEYAGDKIITNTLFSRFDSTNGMSVYRPTFKVTYSYDNNGDVAKVIEYQKQVNGPLFYKLSERVIQQYDNAKNPLAVLNYLTLLTLYEIQGNKNILKQKLYDALGNEEESTVNTFQYDDAKYPISGTSTVTPGGGSPITASLIYYYK